MSGKPDPNEVKIGMLLFPLSNIIISDLLLQVYMRAVGGEIGAASALAPKVGPLGLVLPLCDVKYGLYILLFSLPRRLVRTSKSAPWTGRVWRSQSNWPSKTVKPRPRLFPVPPLWLSRLLMSPRVTARRAQRTVSSNSFKNNYLYNFFNSHSWR